VGTLLEVWCPRINELAEEAVGLAGGDSYFNDLDDDIRRIGPAREYYLALEQDLAQLDQKGWATLKRKCLKYAGVRSERRGWDQLISTLNEAKGYCLLLRIGFLAPEFVEEGDLPTPDVRGARGSEIALVEVKTIHESDAALARKQEFGRGPLTFSAVPADYADMLKKKLSMTIEAAVGQLGSADRRIVYLVIHPDAPLTAQHLDELVASLRAVRPRNVEVVFEVRGAQSSLIPRVAE
jgi:hypothetical protein